MTTVVSALGHDWESRMVARVDGLPGVTVGHRCVDLADLLATVAAGHGDVVLVSTDVRGLDRDALARLTADGVTVLGATRDGDEGSERTLRQLGLSAVVHLDTPDEELASLLASVQDRRVPASSLPGGAAGPDSPPGATRPGGPTLGPLDLPDDGDPATVQHSPSASDGTPQVPAEPGPVELGRVVAVWGATGAPGRTTVAVGLASELAASGVPTLLIDLDTYGASVAQVLSLIDEAPGVAAAARAADLGTLDLTALARLAPEAAPGLRILSGIPTPTRWTEVRGPAVEHILDVARRLAPVIVIDCGFSIEDDEELSYDTLAPRRNATTLVALEAADELVVVGAGDPVGLQRMVRAVQGVEPLTSATLRPVVNRVRASSVGNDPERRIGDSLLRFAGLEQITFLPDDPAATDAALLSGRTLSECAPSSPLRQALAALAALTTGRDAPRAQRRRRMAAAR